MLDLQNETTDKIISAFYTVYNKLGFGFLEKVYQNSMLIELQKQGLVCHPQKKIIVYYDNTMVGEYYADIIVNNSVILELKASEILVPENECQLVNYLRATDIEVGLLLNFGKKPEIKRKIYTNNLKKR